ncbi:MAG: hypothetical protein AABX96_02220 [Nanoarchaeota archaeon]
MDNRQWYWVMAQLGHQGAGRSLDVDVYVWVKNPLEAMIKYRRMGGIKKHRMPNIFPLSSEKSHKLEIKILEDGLSLEKAKRKWYTSSKEYRWW